MRIIGTTEKEKAGGYYIRDATIGFFGEHEEGALVLETMGLDTDALPFSMAYYLKHKTVRWKDCNDQLVTLSFNITEQRITFRADYLNFHKNNVLFREWETYEDKEDVVHLESEAIGNMSMLCLYDKLKK